MTDATRALQAHLRIATPRYASLAMTTGILRASFFPRKIQHSSKNLLEIAKKSSINGVYFPFFPFMYRTHNNGDLRPEHLDQTVTLSGWVRHRRDHGGIIFVDLWDRYGITQVVFDPNIDEKAHSSAENLRSEWVITVRGVVRSRGEGLENPRLATGQIEVAVEQITVINEAKTPPFELESTADVREELRLEHRYLDLRTDRWQSTIQARTELAQTVRNFLSAENFQEVETPVLIKGTPEGAREYLVPSRVNAGKFYVLPQSPQQLKQLLMLSGVDRYFQFARCFRDEDLRGDRQPEFVQLDLELSFVTQEEILQLIENLLSSSTKSLFPRKNTAPYETEGRWPRLTWQQAVSQYGSDKPDLRFDLKFTDLSDLAVDSGFAIFAQSARLFALKFPRKIGELSRKDLEDLTAIAQVHGAGGLAWYRVGEESGPVAKNASADFLKELKERTEADSSDLILFGAGADLWSAASPLGAVRSALGERFKLASAEDFAWAWVTDFPLFDQADNGSLQSAHHPFTSPHPEDLSKLKTDPLSVRSEAYDLILNGYEVGGGSIRIHDPSLQHQIFETLGLSDQEISDRFGHLLESFEYGCPPHGGFAVGWDRLVMVLLNQPNLREVIVFPKNQSAQDLLLGAPSELPEKELKQQHIRVL